MAVFMATLAVRPVRVEVTQVTQVSIGMTVGTCGFGLYFALLDHVIFLDNQRLIIATRSDYYNFLPKIANLLHKFREDPP